MAENLQTRLDALLAENQTLRSLYSRLKTENAAEVCRVAVKLPPFWPDRVTAWFAQAEAQFHLAGINTDVTMYSHILTQIDQRIAGEVEDILTNPPAEGKYEKLKAALINRLSASEDQRMRRLISDEELGERRPSQFLRHLRSLAGTTVSCDKILRQLWLRRLPQHVQAILAAQVNLDLDMLAEIADKIVETQPGPANVYAAASPPLANLLERVEELSEQVAALSSNRSGQQNRSLPQNNQASRSPTTRRCWYHRKFGAKALKCIAPCNWKAGNSAVNQ